MTYAIFACLKKEISILIHSNQNAYALSILGASIKRHEVFNNLYKKSLYSINFDD